MREKSLSASSKSAPSPIRLYRAKNIFQFLLKIFGRFRFSSVVGIRGENICFCVWRFNFCAVLKKCSGKFAQTAARNRISSRSKNIFALALKTFGKNPSGGGVGNEGERLRVWDYPNKQNAGAFYGKGTPFLCLLRKKQAANGYSFAVLAP